MDNEIFITHLLNSLPQAEYEAAILVSKDKLRKGAVHLPEIEQTLEDKYSSMKNVKRWDEKEDDYALSTSHSNKKSHKKQFKGQCGYCGGYDTKQPIVPIRQTVRARVQNGNLTRKRNTVLKERTMEKDKNICPELYATIAENMDILHMTV